MAHWFVSKQPGCNKPGASAAQRGFVRYAA